MHVPTSATATACDVLFKPPESIAAEAPVCPTHADAAMLEKPGFTSHEQYIAGFPAHVAEILLRVKAEVESALPAAERCIGYNMPAYRAGKIFFYFAAFRDHLGIYPPVRDDAELIRELSPYSNDKGNLAFRYKQPIPYDLIRRVAVALERESARR